MNTKSKMLMVFLMVMLLVPVAFGFRSRPLHRMLDAVQVYPGDDIQDAYDYLTSSDRDAAMGTLSVTNQRTLVFTAGNYTSTSFALDTAYVNIEGLGSATLSDLSGVTIDCGKVICRISNLRIDASSIANGLSNDANTVCSSVTLTDGTDDQILIDGLSGALTYDQSNTVFDWGSTILKMSEITDPGTDPAANTGWIYLEDAAGTTTPYFEDSAGTTTSMIAGAGTPAGSDTQMQYNNAGAFGEIATIIWDDTNLEFANDQSAAFGTAADWTVNFDDSVDDQLIWLTAATTAGATTDPLYEIIVGAAPTADQQVFGVAKGTQASNTALFTVDEDGDAEVAGSLSVTGAFYQQAIAAASAGNVNLTIDAAGNGTITVGATSTGKAIFTREVDLDGAVTLGDSTADDITVTGLIVSGVTLDDGVTDSPAFTLTDATNETVAIIKLDNGDTTVTIPADTDLEITTGNLAVGNGSPGTASMDGEDFYCEGEAEFDSAVQFDGLPTGALGLTITGAAVNLNVSSNFAANVATGTSTGTVTIGGSAAQIVNIGDGAAAKTVTLGSSNTTSTTTLLSGSGELNLNVSNNQPTNIGTGTTTGTVTVGGAGIQTINVGDGAAAKTVTLGSSNTTSTTTLLSGSSGLNLNVSNNQPTNIGTGTTTGTVTVGGAGIQAIDIGNGAAAKTVAIGSINTTSTTTINAGSGGIQATALVTFLGQTRKQFFTPKDVELDGTSPAVLTDTGTDGQTNVSTLTFDADGGATGDDIAYIMWHVPDGYIVDSARLNIAYSFSTAEDAADEAQFDFTVNGIAQNEAIDAAGTALADQTTVIADASTDNGNIHTSQYNIEVETIAVDDYVIIQIAVDESASALTASGTLDVHYLEIEWESTE